MSTSKTSPEQQQQLKDAADQFQQKCLLSFKKNRSGVPYLKNEMPRVLLPGESDAMTQQEREECMQAFQDAADDILGRHHRAFLGAFKQMMVAVFGPGMEQVLNEHPFREAPWRLESLVLSRRCEASQSSLPRRVLEAKPSSLLHRVLEVSQFNPLCRPQEGNHSSHLRRAAQGNLCNSRIHISPRMGSWHLDRLWLHLLPAIGLPQLATGRRRICTVEATTR
jgi:hypothetical protein